MRPTCVLDLEFWTLEAKLDMGRGAALLLIKLDYTIIAHLNRDV